MDDSSSILTEVESSKGDLYFVAKILLYVGTLSSYGILVGDQQNVGSTCLSPDEAVCQTL